LLFTPWIILTFGIYWESSLIPLMPDFLNDIISILQLRRVTTLSSLIYIPIISLLLSNIIILLIKTTFQEVLTGNQITKLKNQIKRVGFASEEYALTITVVIFSFFYVVFLGNGQIQTFKKFINFDHVEFDYFLEDKYRFGKVVGTEKSEEPIPLPALLETCNWVKKNTPLDSALIHPTFMLDVRVHCKRQVFLSEKEDGNMSLYSRKFATLYIQRFADIHKDLTYKDLHAAEYGSEKPNSLLRKQYLSLDEEDIENLKKKYPGYSYFMAEKKHMLDYPIIFKNRFFYLYDIR
jgi:hypothetical protein